MFKALLPRSERQVAQAGQVASSFAVSSMQAPSRFSKASGGVISLFHDEQASLCVPLAASSHNADVPVCISSVHEPSRTAASSCAACVAIFADYIEQRAHFKSDWHRYAYLRRVAAIHSSISSIRLPNLKNAFPFIYTTNPHISF